MGLEPKIIGPEVETSIALVICLKKAGQTGGIFHVEHLHIPIDPAHQASQNLFRSHLDKTVMPICHEPLHGLLPKHGTADLIDQFIRGLRCPFQGQGIHIADHGNLRLPEGASAHHGFEFLAGQLHTAAVPRTADIELHAFLGSGILTQGDGLFDRRNGPGNNNLLRAIEVGDFHSAQFANVGDLS